MNSLLTIFYLFRENSFDFLCQEILNTSSYVTICDTFSLQFSKPFVHSWSKEVAMQQLMFSTSTTSTFYQSLMQMDMSTPSKVEGQGCGAKHAQDKTSGVLGQIQTETGMSILEVCTSEDLNCTYFVNKNFKNLFLRVCFCFLFSTYAFPHFKKGKAEIYFSVKVY